MTYQHFVIAQLAAFAYQQGARHGGINNMLAVAQVIANRQRAHWKGGDWIEILDAAPEVAGTVYTPWPVNPRDQNFRRLLVRIDDIYHGNPQEDLTDGALFFAELHNIDRDWFYENITHRPEAHVKLAKVGEVTFFG